MDWLRQLWPANRSSRKSRRYKANQFRVRRNRWRGLGVERLEERCVLSAAPGLEPALVSAAWFENLLPGNASVQGGPSAAMVDGQATESATATSALDWIVRFQHESLAGISSVAQTANLLTDGVSFSIVRGLGIEGQVLVRTFDAGLSAVESWLGASTHVASFELDQIRTFQQIPNDSQFSSLWGLNNTGQSGGVADADIDAPEAWNTTIGSSSIVVGVIDTGVDYTHPDLAGNIWTNPGEIAGNGLDDDGNGFVDDIHGFDFVNNDGNPMDDNSHGTHVAGTIAGQGNNGVGVTGVAWEASIMGLKFLSAGGSGSLSNAIRAVNYATMMRNNYGVNVRITNNSWGGGGYSQALYDAIAASGAAGILFVAAAGNDGTNNDSSPHYPSNYNLANVVSVAATDRYDQLASFSNYGQSSVDLAAPGVSITSTVPGGGYASYSGTSMATPHVAGVAVLAWSLNPNATVAQVRQALLDGVDQISSLAGLVATGGRLNAYNTLQLLGATPPPGNQIPYVSSLSGSPDPVVADGTLTLTANGVGDSDGNVAAVYFYHDANYSGVLDSGDTLLEADTSIVNGQASLALSASGIPAGTERFFARAIDDEGDFGDAVSTTVVVGITDDHGDDAQNSTAAALNATVGGSIQFAGDADWFSFQATAGFTYSISTTLTGLADSILSLYASNGTTLLAFDDDGGPGLASLITWTAGTTGTYYVAVEAYASSQTGGYALRVQESSPFEYNGSTLTVRGTAATDTFSFTAGTQHTVTLNGTSVQINPATITTVRFLGNGGGDTVTLRGRSTTTDTATLRPGSGELIGTNYRVEVQGVYRIDVYGNSTDTARLDDSPGNDTFRGYSNRAYLSGSGFLNYARGFGTVRAYATTGNDVGTLYDSTGNDRYYAYSDRAWLTGTGFYNAGYGFDTMTSIASSGTDVAYLYDSAGNDTFRGYSDRAYMSGSNFTNHARAFDSVYATSSQGGADTAFLYDSTGNDTFYGRSNYGYLTGTGFYNRATGFGRVEAHGINGGVNRYNVSGVSYTFARYGSWVRA